MRLFLWLILVLLPYLHQFFVSGEPNPNKWTKYDRADVGGITTILVGFTVVVSIIFITISSKCR